MDKGPNNIRRIGDTIEIELTQGYWTVIDAASYDKVKNYRWYANIDDQGKVRTISNTIINGKKSTVILYRIILDAPSGLDVDHKNLDTLDNRVSNIRLATRTQNNCNKWAWGISGLKNIYWKPKENRWRVQVQNESGKYTKSFPVSQNLSNKDSQLKRAIEYRNNQLIELHGDFARF